MSNLSTTDWSLSEYARKILYKQTNQSQAKIKKSSFIKYIFPIAVEFKKPPIPQLINLKYFCRHKVFNYVLAISTGSPSQWHQQTHEYKEEAYYLLCWRRESPRCNQSKSLLQALSKPKTKSESRDTIKPRIVNNQSNEPTRSGIHCKEKEKN